MVTLAYLCGSVSWAVILTRARTGREIREMGNLNAGTANVARTVGKGLAALVFFLDGLKVLAPLFLARFIAFGGDSPRDSLGLFATAIAAVIGHVRPLFFELKGGAGAAATLFAYLFFVPVEVLGCAVIAFLIVMVFLRGRPYAFGRWIPMIFSLLTPFVVLIDSALVDIHLVGRVSIGGHPWHVTAGVFALSLLLLAVNRRVILSELRRLRSR